MPGGVRGSGGDPAAYSITGEEITSLPHHAILDNFFKNRNS